MPEPWWRPLESKFWGRAFVSVFGPLWRVHWLLGPVGSILPFAAGAVVAFFSPASAVIVFLVWLLMLTVWNVRTREKRAYDRTHGEVVLLGQLYDDGRWRLDGLGTSYSLLGLGASDAEIDLADAAITKDKDRCRSWRRNAEGAIRNRIGPDAARLFQAHPDVTLTESPPQSLPEYELGFWEDMAYCLAWIAKRLAAFEGRP